MGRLPIKIGVLTSSRADYGIYLPLLRAMQEDPYFETKLIVFGTHLSEKYGNSVKQIEVDGFKISQKLLTIPEGDGPKDIAISMGKTLTSFSGIWSNGQFDLVIALGDRFEMFSAVASAVPFNIPIAHIHGGETTLGAIDNAFRNCLTAMSDLHFTSCEEYYRRVVEIRGYNTGVYNTGALSVDLMQSMKFLNKDDFFKKYGIDLERPTILCTFHPETVKYQENETHVKILISVLNFLHKYQVVITMPNADTANAAIRKKLLDFAAVKTNVYAFENLGSTDYLSCMKHCSFVLGNSSSGFVEAAWFQKPVINIGTRQEGRHKTSNIYSCKIDMEDMLSTVRDIENSGQDPIDFPYGDGTTATKIVAILKEYFYDRS
jgi:GDP/UDP-N,N'-diacetylbacillosamine 2-epimerase (hydrolysing)